MIVGCYVLDLYCDDPNHPIDVRESAQFTNELGSKTRAAAKRSGWQLDLENGTAVCPKCVARHGLARASKSA